MTQKQKEERATWTVLIHAFAKTGKSWLLDTLPAPRLILDAEGRTHFTPSKPKLYWNPLDGPPPEMGDAPTCVVPIPPDGLGTVEAAYRWLRSGQHPFVSVGLDSATEIQKRVKDEVRPGTEALRQQDWGELLRRGERIVRDFRDLRLVPATGIKVIAYLAGTRETEFGKELLLEGALRDQLAYYVDTVGYLYKAQREDGSFARGLLVDQQPGFVAGDGTGRIISKHGPTAWDPNLSDLYDLMKEEQ